MKTIAIDIDGTIRDLDSKIIEYLEKDHPHRVKAFEKAGGRWDRLVVSFNNNRESVTNWLYDERAFHLFGAAPKMYTQVIDHLNAISKIAELADEDYEVSISSVQYRQSITATLFWLAKQGCRIKSIKFHDDFEMKANAYYDYVVDDHPEVLEAAKKNGSVPIVVPHSYNEHLTEKDGYRRLDYTGEKPTGLSGVIDIVGLRKFEVVGDKYEH